MDATLDDLVQSHWLALVKACSANAPLATSLLHELPDELDWKALSENPRLDWSIELVQAFAARWAWQGLLRNPGIPWDANWRRTFADRIDWFYLSQNPAILDADVLLEHGDDVVWAFVASQPTLSAELRQALAEHLEGHDGPEPTPTESLTLGDVANDRLIREPGELDLTTPVAELTPEELAATGGRFTWWKAERALPRLTGGWVPVALEHGDPTAPRLYDEGLAPLLAERGGFGALLRSVRARRAPYRVLVPAENDAYGLIPALEIPSTEDAEGPVKGTLRSLREGPVRVLELPYLAKRYHARLAVADRLLPLLRAHHLPPHRVLPLRVPEDPHGRTFHVIQFDDLYRADAPVALDEAFDLVPWGPAGSRVMKHLLVSDRLAATLDAADATGRTCTTALHLRLSAPEPPPVEEVQVAPRTLSDPRSRSFRAAEAKRDRLASLTRRLPDDHDADEPVWGPVEERLQVSFPDSFRERYVEGGPVGLDFRYLPRSELHPLEGYDQTHPEFAGAVVVARNTLGDAVVLKLLKRSDHALGATLYETRHESGRITRLRKR